MAILPSRRRFETKVLESLADVRRQADDMIWHNMTNESGESGTDMTTADRKAILERSRIYSVRDPLVKQSIRLIKVYTFGRGLSYKAVEEKSVAPCLETFWKDPGNRKTFTSPQAQKENCGRLVRDGEIFFRFFVGKNGTVKIRRLEPISVVNVITDPDDSEMVRWYEVNVQTSEYEFGSGHFTPKVDPESKWIRDWQYRPQDKHKQQPPDERIMDGCVYHIKINALGKRGIPDTYASLDWAKAYKEFMEDRATLTKALARLAWKKKIKGGASKVTQALVGLKSTYANLVSQGETNPPTAAGSTVVENEGVDWSQMKTNTGANNADIDGRMLVTTFGAGMGIMNHYFGDGSDSNLATATAMELPMLKAFESGQEMWAGIYLDVFSFVLGCAASSKNASTVLGDEVVDPITGAVSYDHKELDIGIDIDFPPIVQKDIKPYLEAIVAFAGLAPGSLKAKETAVRMALSAFGQNGLEDLVTDIFKDLEAEAAAAPDPDPNKPPEDLDVEEGTRKLLSTLHKIKEGTKERKVC